MNSAQFRYADGALFRRDPKPYAHDLRILDLGSGQVEAIAMPRYAWTEVDAPQEALENAALAQDHQWSQAKGEWLKTEPTEAELLDRAARNRERSARRARTQVRRLVKWKRLDTMLTLTYRENMEDRARMARDFDVFLKRVRRVLPGFEYVCVFERQKRGAWHAHLAVQRVQSHYLVKGVLVKSYDLLRAIWRAVAGEGNVDVSKARKHRHKGVCKLAGYLSKYLSKSFEEGGEGNSYRASGRALPKATVIRSMETEQHAVAEELMRLMRSFWPRGEFYGAYLDGGGYYLALSP